MGTKRFGPVRFRKINPLHLIINLNKGGKTVLKYAISFTLLPLSAFSQDMGANILSYKDAEQSFNQKIVDWSEVRVNLIFQWCDDKKEYFYTEIDVNSDKVVNKRDVSTINQDEAKIYASELTNTLFTFWAPDLNEHLEKTTASLNNPFFEKDIISLNKASTTIMRLLLP